MLAKPLVTYVAPVWIAVTKKSVSEETFVVKALNVAVKPSKVINLHSFMH